MQFMQEMAKRGRLILMMDQNGVSAKYPAVPK
jgi:hypothetical protein